MENAKTCIRGNLECNYASLNGSQIQCNYQEYCDYQLPRDSRQITGGSTNGKT